MNKNSYAKLASALIIAAGLMHGCGNQDQAPVDGTLIVSPSSIEISDSGATPGGGANCGLTYPPASWDVFAVRVSILDGNGELMGKTKFTVNIPWTQTTANWVALSWVYEDMDGNNSVTDSLGNLQNATEEVTSMGDPTLYITETNEFGYKDLFVVLDAECAWTGTLDVQSGPLSEQVD
ncbi:MAG: hypothetical protein OEY67_10775, partial [Gammaproteobacteria bacterium]|nr:hypothetical protein [Gammaproteobacteria bacterium]